MVRYWKFNVTSDDGIRLKYPQDILNKIRGAKYHKILENFGIGEGNIVRVGCAKSDEDLGNIATEVSKTDYDNFDNINPVTDKSQINADGTDIATLSVKSPNPRGKVIFDVTLPDGTQKRVQKTVDSEGKANTGINELVSNTKGTIEVKISVNGIHSLTKATDEILIDAV